MLKCDARVVVKQVQLLCSILIIPKAVGEPAKKRGKKFVPDRFFDELQVEECIIVYKRLRRSKVGRGYLNLSITALPKFISPEVVLEKHTRG